MTTRPLCSILSFDYFDFDVFLNILVFYRLASYRISTSFDLCDSALAVVLRGIPPRIFSEFIGELHIYDYVKEYSIDYTSYFPNATRILVVSLVHNAVAPHFIPIYGYLPVIPEIWTRTFSDSSKNYRPIHVSNYKPMGDDLYQSQLLQLFHDSKVDVYGSRWHQQGLPSKPVSHLTANLLMSKSLFSFGLMYPYQRGTSLSGRMWQAPIHGCLVISELGTNIFNCPGVLEVSNFNIDLSTLPRVPRQLADQAISFWKEKTSCLAEQLGLHLNTQYLVYEILYAKLLLLKQHFLFSWKNYVVAPLCSIKATVRKSARSILSRS